jgi:hypothetical protein
VNLRTTPEQRAELLRLHEAATPAPLRARFGESIDIRDSRGRVAMMTHLAGDERRDTTEVENTAKLFAAARNIVRDLLADVEALAGEADRLRSLVERAMVLFGQDDECSDPSTSAYAWYMQAKHDLECHSMPTCEQSLQDAIAEVLPVLEAAAAQIICPQPNRFGSAVALLRRETINAKRDLDAILATTPAQPPAVEGES